jgi:hypothetical protein
MSSVKFYAFAETQICLPTHRALSVDLAASAIGSAAEVNSHLVMCRNTEAHVLFRFQISPSPHAHADMPTLLRLPGRVIASQTNAGMWLADARIQQAGLL